MRIKSYFDSSIQTAMRQARQEFGDDVMLVTSRIAAPECRYLGDFEVVFAVDETAGEKAAAPEAASAPQAEPAFGDMFRAASGAGISSAPGLAGDDREAAIAGIHSRLLDMGLEPAATEGMIALIRLFSSRSAAQPALSGAATDTAIGVAHDAVTPPPGNEWAREYRAVPGFEPAMEDAASADLIALGAVLASAVPEPAAVSRKNDVTPGNDDADSRAGPVLHAGPGEPADPGAHDIPGAVPAAPRAPAVPPQSGFALMLAAFGLYGIMRRSGS